MANTNVEPANHQELGVATFDESSTTDIGGDTFTLLNNCRVYFAVEKPSTSGLTITALYPSGATTTLVSVGTGDGVTSALYLEDRDVELPSSTVLTVTTTGGVSGDKKVTIIARRIDA